ncbi:MAG: hypothetical protein ACYTHN_17875, partial [Planctomycetota bacterium]
PSSPSDGPEGGFASPPESTTFTRVERLCFLVLGNQDISLRTAKETLQTAPDVVEPAIFEIALTLSVRAAETQAIGGSAGALPETGGGGWIPADADEAFQDLFFQLDPHSRALLLSHFALSFPPSSTVGILGLHPHSLAINLASLLGKLRSALGGDPSGESCQAPQAPSVEPVALGIASQEEEAEVSQHLASGCETCRLRQKGLQTEREHLQRFLQPLLIPDRSPDSIAEAGFLLDGESSSIPINPAKVMGMSKNSCMAVAMLFGLLAAFLIGIGTLSPEDRAQLVAILGWRSVKPTEESAPSPAPSPSIPSIRTRAYTLKNALDDLGSSKPDLVVKARREILRRGKRQIETLLNARREREALRPALDAILLDLARVEIKSKEQKFRRGIPGLRGTAEKRAKKEFAAYPERRSVLESAIREGEETLDRLRASGASREAILAVERSLKADQVRLGRLEGMDLETLTYTLELRLQAESRAWIQRLKAHREILTVEAAVQILRGKTPSFPWREAIRAQGALPLPPFAELPLAPEVAVHRLATWVDFPVVLDPAILQNTESVDLSAQKMTVAQILERITEAVGGTAVPHGGAMFITGSREGLPPDLLAFLAEGLSGGSPQSRWVSALGFQALTAKDFGIERFSPQALESGPILQNLRAWYAENRDRIVQDPKTGRYRVPGN